MSFVFKIEFFAFISLRFQMNFCFYALVRKRDAFEQLKAFALTLLSLLIDKNRKNS